MSEGRQCMTYVMCETMPAKFIQKGQVRRARRRYGKKTQQFTFYSDGELTTLATSSTSQLSQRPTSRGNTVSTPTVNSISAVPSNAASQANIVEDSEADGNNEPVGIEAIHKRISERAKRSPELPIIQSTSADSSHGPVSSPVPDNLSSRDDPVTNGHHTGIEPPSVDNASPNTTPASSVAEADNEPTTDVENISTGKKQLRLSSRRRTERKIDKVDAGSNKRRTVDRSGCKASIATPSEAPPLRTVSNGGTSSERTTKRATQSGSTSTNAWLSTRRKSHKQTPLSREVIGRKSDAEISQQPTSSSQVLRDTRNNTRHALDDMDFVAANHSVVKRCSRKGIHKQKNIPRKPGSVRLFVEPVPAKSSATRQLTNLDVVCNYLDDAVTENRTKVTVPAIDLCMVNFSEKMHSSLRKANNTAQRMTRLKSAIYKVRREIRSGRKRLLDMKIEQRQMEVELCEVKKRHRATCGKMKETNAIGDFLSQLTEFYNTYPKPAENETCQIFHSQPSDGPFHEQIREINTELVDWMQE